MVHFINKNPYFILISLCFPNKLFPFQDPIHSTTLQLAIVSWGILARYCFANVHKFCFFWCFSHVEWIYEFGEEHRRVEMLLSAPHVKGTCYKHDDTNFDHLSAVEFARFLHYTITFSPFSLFFWKQVSKCSQHLTA